MYKQSTTKLATIRQSKRWATNSRKQQNKQQTKSYEQATTLLSKQIMRSLKGISNSY